MMRLKCGNFSANENRYEGSWKDDKKNGPGKFYYLTHGQIYEGVWNDDVAKCGTMKDFSRDSAPEPTVYPIPKVSICMSRVTTKPVFGVSDQV